MVPKGKTAEYLIINGVECEPYLTADEADDGIKSKR
jgi:Na+-translocating ferredoxin:NAD+ oxidoreductase RnfC subunit